MTDSTKLIDALGEIGRDPDIRRRLIALLVDWERSHREIGRDVREETSGPIVDALFREVGEVSKTLDSGLVFTQPYRSKIAREFAMGDDTPDHVWEPQTTRLLKNLCQRPGDVVIGGAYSGDHAVIVAAGLAEHEASVHCFEPNDLQREALARNRTANALNNLAISELGLWNRVCWLVLEGDDSHASPVEVAEAREGAFATTTIDAYCRTHGVERLSTIVLDIEGGEYAALLGAGSWLSLPRSEAPDLVFEIHASYTDWSRGLEATDVVRLVRDAGYETFAIRDVQGNLDLAHSPLELIPTDRAYIAGPPHGFNLFASKDPDRVAWLDAKLRSDVSPKLLFHRDPKLHQPLVD